MSPINDLKTSFDNNDSVIRRLNADEIDFKDFSNYDLKVTDPVFDIEMILSLMS